MEVSLKYTDDTDKSYGLAGVAVSMFIYDSDEDILSLSLDEEEEIKFIPDFFTASNPDFSPKKVWSYHVQQFEMYVAMTLGNYMCRQIVNRRKSVDPFAKAELRKKIIEDGKELCSLGDDEIDSLFNKGYSNMQRIFSHPGVQKVVRDFSSRLIDSRMLSRDEIVILLRSLQNL
ncbi:MAG: hypothetical protein ACI30S_07115 [Muribaculaceae bacterium]